MKIELNHGSPVPLYHQIAEAIQFRIAIGELRHGDALPTLRQAATDWAVNLHTVGRAYRELAERGFVQSRGRSGTRVLGSPRVPQQSQGRSAGIPAFVGRVAREARIEHGLGAADLAALLINWPESEVDAPHELHFVECSRSQCLQHAEEIEARWHVRVRPWVLDQAGEPPPGPILSTYFHYHEVRQRWPDRRNDLHFLAIQPDARLADLLAPLLRDCADRTVYLCEFDEPKALNSVAELSLTLPPDEYDLQARVVERGRVSELFVDEASSAPLVLPPRVWADLPDELRSDPRAIPLRFFIDRDELESLGRDLAWGERPAASAA